MYFWEYRWTYEVLFAFLDLVLLSWSCNIDININLDLLSRDLLLHYPLSNKPSLDRLPLYFNKISIVRWSYHFHVLGWTCLIAEYIPYSFQILAQMLDLHSADVPVEYRGLLPFLLTSSVWQQKGSIPGLVKLLKAFLSRDSPSMLANGQVTSVLAVIQQRLIPSKIHDSWGFELLNSVVMYVRP